LIEILLFTIILPISKLQAQLLMTSLMRSHIEYLIEYVVMLLLQSNFMQNL